MKKRNLKTLTLNKKAISSMANLVGGRPPRSFYCDSWSDISRTGNCHPTASEYAC
ncbi:hypothetical protein [uncultured Kordia sp.]|uniref:hypothetical protein n=1 Tax=uncultured Kordia sp. TaxID=507699 RepID=UPI00261AC6A7|nr:hypothetical protein [uncultured Kordia sp.]